MIYEKKNFFCPNEYDISMWMILLCVTYAKTFFCSVFVSFWWYNRRVCHYWNKYFLNEYISLDYLILCSRNTLYAKKNFFCAGLGGYSFLIVPYVCLKFFQYGKKQILCTQQARKFKKVQAKKKNSWNQMNHFLWNCISAVLNFFLVQKLIFGHFWNCKKWNWVK